MPMQFGVNPCSCQFDPPQTKLIAVTGGPGAGKTAVLEMAMRSFCSRICVLPESAGVVFSGGFPRLSSDVARQAAQRAIFSIQEQLERVVIDDCDVAVALCDRGTPDGAAYWPGTVDSFWGELGTTAKAEHDKYSVVIHLRTPSLAMGYNHSNSLRTETPEEARRLDDRIIEAWDGHPNRVIINSEQDFLGKAEKALELIQSHLPPDCAFRAR